MSDRLAVRKTYKLYLGGAFPRSESGRTYEVLDTRGRFLANAAWASRKDARDAVVAARGAFAGWVVLVVVDRAATSSPQAVKVEKDAATTAIAAAPRVMVFMVVPPGHGPGPSGARWTEVAAGDRGVDTD